MTCDERYFSSTAIRSAGCAEAFFSACVAGRRVSGSRDRWPESVG
jgi:hypothetical protein